MATPFHVIVDDLLDTRPRDLVAYARGLLPELLRTRPEGIEVTGFVSSSPQAEYDEVTRLLPGLDALERSALAHRELAAAWQRGLVRPLGGMVHSPSLFAPLTARGDQTVVTVHDAIAWIEPDTVDGAAGWYRAMAKRADRFADAVVVPSYAVAAALEEEGLFADRMRVIPGAATVGLSVPDDAVARRGELGLPEKYVASAATLNPRKGLRELLAALRDLDVALIVLGDPSHGDRVLATATAEAGIAPERIHVIDATDPATRATAVAGAAAFVEPSRLEGFGADVLDAMALGVPVVSTDDPALVELALDAARVVERGDGLADGLRDAIADLLADPAATQRLGVAGQDRARAFSWRDTAERVWQLHADL